MSAHPESKWTHPMCDQCWGERQPGRVPHRLVEDVREDEVCCFCGKETRSGIYVREDPALTTCEAVP